MSSAVNLCCLHQFVFFSFSFSLFFFSFSVTKFSVRKGASNTHHDGSMLRAPLFVQEFDQVSYVPRSRKNLCLLLVDYVGMSVCNYNNYPYMVVIRIVTPVPLLMVKLVM